MHTSGEAVNISNLALDSLMTTFIYRLVKLKYPDARRILSELSDKWKSLSVTYSSSLTPSGPICSKGNNQVSYVSEFISQ